MNDDNDERDGDQPLATGSGVLKTDLDAGTPLPRDSSDADFYMSAASSAATTPVKNSSADLPGTIAHRALSSETFTPSPNAFLSGENIPLTDSGSGRVIYRHGITEDEVHNIGEIRRNQSYCSLATSPYGVHDSDNPNIMDPPPLPLTSQEAQRIRQQVLQPCKDSPPAESVQSSKPTSLIPPHLDTTISARSKPFVEDLVSATSLGSSVGPKMMPALGPTVEESVAAPLLQPDLVESKDLEVSGVPGNVIVDMVAPAAGPSFRGGGSNTDMVMHKATVSGGWGSVRPLRPPRHPPQQQEHMPSGYRMSISSIFASNHRRGQSLGDQSNLSVLTDPSFGDVEGIGHKRGVSWDLDAGQSPGLATEGGGSNLRVLSPRNSATGIAPSAIFQPVLTPAINHEGDDVDANEEEKTFSQAPAPLLMSPAPSPEVKHFSPSNIASQIKDLASPTSSNQRSCIPDKVKAITLTDIVKGSHEEEAEACIIDALERRERIRANRGSSPSPGCSHLAGFSDEAAHNASVFFSRFESPESNQTNRRDGAWNTLLDSIHPSADSGHAVEHDCYSEIVGLTEQLVERMDVESNGQVRRRRREMLMPMISKNMVEFKGVDHLMQNANTLFHRGRRRKLATVQTETRINDIESQIGCVDGSRQWANKESVNKKDDGDMRNRDGQAEPQGKAFSSGGGVCVPQTQYRTTDALRSTTGRQCSEAINCELRPKRREALLQIPIVLGLMLPCIIVAVILFYAFDNPLMCSAVDHACASWSWLLLFLGVRQMITLFLSKVIEFCVVDVFVLRSRLALKLFGPFVTLLIVQSKGWPFQLTFWAILDFIMLHGNGRFANHWLFYQKAVGLFNAVNRSGYVTSSDIYTRILAAAIIAGILTGLKRLWLSIFLGTRSCHCYGPRLKSVMKQMLLLSEVANLSKKSDSGTNGGAQFLSHAEDAKKPDTPVESCDEATPQESPSSRESSGISASSHLPESTSLSNSSRLSELTKVIGEWEEPDDIVEYHRSSTPWRRTQKTVQDILDFRRAVRVLENPYPFSLDFGLAPSREQCVESSQKLYDDLLSKCSTAADLSFECLSVLAVNTEGVINTEKLRDLVRLFRPDRSGKVSKLDFVLSIDSLYKRFRLLRASIASSTQIELEYEHLVNSIYYFLLSACVLAICTLNPWLFVASVAAVLVPFAFCFGTAASKCLEGLLMIFTRQPYDIGDRIAISPVDKETSLNGSSSWYVEKVTMFATTARYALTNEVATFANGTLANSCIINAARSPKATIHVSFKFSLHVPFEKVSIFRESIETFAKARPREWVRMSAFRANVIETDLGYVEYSVALVHRERWQNLSAILDSKADLQGFAFEVQRRLGMRYVAPAAPIKLEQAADGEPSANAEVLVDTNAAAAPDLQVFAEDACKRE